MTSFLIILSAIVTIIAALPYIIEVIRGRTKPRVVSWFTWSVLTGIACAASFADGQVPGGILMLAATIETVLIVILGFKHGDRKFDKLDIYCLIGALAGLVLWFVFNSPAVAILATIAIDLVGAIPTFKHSWQKPHEETWITFALSGLGGGITVIIAGGWEITAIAYPLYILLINVLLTALILVSPYRKLTSEPAELREL